MVLVDIRKRRGPNITDEDLTHLCNHLALHDIHIKYYDLYVIEQK